MQLNLIKKIKIATVILFLAVICFEVAPQSISIASYNMLRLGANKKDYATLASVIKNFDVVGAIEVIKEDGMKETMKYLSDWSYIISEKSVGTKFYKEYFGFFYDDKIELVKTLGFYPNDNEFMRTPYGAQFKIKDSNFTFNLIIVHIVFGSSVKERISEINNLGKVYSYYEEITGNNEQTIIAGDFNFENINEFNELIDLNSKEVLPIKKTTLGKNGPVSDYDHMFVSSKLIPYIVESDVLYWTSDWEKSRKFVSDHFPIYIKLNIKEEK